MEYQAEDTCLPKQHIGLLWHKDKKEKEKTGKREQSITSCTPFLLARLTAQRLQLLRRLLHNLHGLRLR